MTIQTILLSYAANIDYAEPLSAELHEILTSNPSLRKSSLRLIYLLMTLINLGERNRANLRSIILLSFSVPHRADEKREYLQRLDTLIKFALKLHALKIQADADADADEID